MTQSCPKWGEVPLASGFTLLGPKAYLKIMERNLKRILLKRRKGQQYLQPSGEWTEVRETARGFPTAVIAYDWASEQELLGIDILLTFEDSKWDFVTFRL